MQTEPKVPQGTTAWFEMVGTLLCEAAMASGLPPHMNLSMIERYTDGVELSAGLVQGIRFDIVDGQPSYQVGVQADQHADITMEITAAAAKQLNKLYSADPAYGAALNAHLSTGAMRLSGDTSTIGGWLASVHDPIVARTV